MNRPVAMGRPRILLAAAGGSVLGSFLLATLLAAAGGLAAAAPLATWSLLGSGVALWLAAHQVPLTLGGVPLGVLPLLPTAAVLVLTATATATARRRLIGRRLVGRRRAGRRGSDREPGPLDGDRYGFASAVHGGSGWDGDAAWVVSVVAGGHASLAVLASALPTGAVAADPWHAAIGGGGVAAVGAGLGLWRAVGPPVWWHTGPGWLRSGLRAAGVGAVALVSVAALMLFAALAASAHAVHDGFALRPGSGAGLGVLVVCVLYLPNALVAAVSWLTGPGVVVGAASASPLSVTVAPLPPVPLLAAMPTHPPPGWAVIVFGLPVVAGVLMGGGCRRDERDHMARLRAVATASVSVSFGYAVLAAVVNGRLAAGPFDPVELPVLSGGLALLAWLGLPASVATLVPSGLPWPGRGAIAEGSRSWAEARVRGTRAGGASARVTEPRLGASPGRGRTSRWRRDGGAGSPEATRRVDGAPSGRDGQSDGPDPSDGVRPDAAQPDSP